jgi:hypothetical protein
LGEILALPLAHALHVLMVNAMYLSNHMLCKLGIWLFLPKFRVCFHVGCCVGSLVGLYDWAKKGRESVWAIEIKHNTT